MEHPLVKIPRTKRGTETLNKILSAAAQVFYEKGYSKASVSKIAELAGVASGTFYIYFDGKHSLYQYLLLQCSHQIRRHLGVATQKCVTRRDVERVGLRCWLEYIRENQYIYSLIWESAYVDRALFLDYYEIFSAAYMRGLSQAQNGGEVQGIDPEVLAYALMGATSFLGMKWGLFESGPVNLNYIVDEFMKILDSGIFTTPVKQAPSPPAPELGMAGGIMFNVEMDEEFVRSPQG